MAVEFEMKVEGDTLRVRARGGDRNPEDGQHWGGQVAEICRTHGVSKFLADERELAWQIAVVDPFELAAFYAAQMPAVTKAAVVCRLEALAEAQFQETAVASRGLILRLFTEIEQAEAWLNG